MAHANGLAAAPSPGDANGPLQERFLEHRERDVRVIVDALQRDDFETVSRLGHNMRGTGTSYGHPEVSAIGERLESAADEQDVHLVAVQLDALSAWIARARARTLER
jgi:HPt (histidine-containing phosphotransfer) domain-containing protein